MLREAFEPRQIEFGVSFVLVIGETAHAFDRDFRGIARQHADRARFQLVFRAWRAGGFFGFSGSNTKRCKSISGIEPAQVGVDRFAFGTDRRTKIVILDRYRFRPGKRAEHHGIELAAGFARGQCEIGKQGAFREFSQHFLHL